MNKGTKAATHTHTHRGTYSKKKKKEKSLRFRTKSLLLGTNQIQEGVIVH